MTLGVSCQHSETSAKKVTDPLIPTTIAVITADSKNARTEAYIEVKNWLDDFKNFRMAVYHQDSAKLKTYFSFPVKDEDGQLWNIINGMKEESPEQRAAHPGEFFTEQDFNANYKQLFPPGFLPGILKIKSETLYKNGQAETKVLSGSDGSYQVSASFNQENQTLFLSINYNNGYDESGNYVSEGEYSIIYAFKILEGKKMLFEKILIAG